MMIHDIFRIITGHIRRERQTVTAGAIWKLIDKNHPVVQFVRMCITANTGKTRCYFDARAAGVAVRKQVQLALYEYLKSEEAPPAITVFCYRDTIEGDGGTGVYGVTLYFIELKELAFFEDVQNHFADEVEKWMRASNNPLSYSPAPLSTCPAPTGTESNDFVFEVGELDSGEITYYGHWRNNRWIHIEIFDEFDRITLMRILKER